MIEADKSSRAASFRAEGGPILRGSRRQVTRYRRYIVIGALAAVGFVVLLALAIGFRPMKEPTRSPDAEGGADGATAAPDFRGLASTYSGLTAPASMNRAGGADPASSTTKAPPPTPEEQQTKTLAQSALSAAPFFGGVVASTARGSSLPATDGGDLQPAIATAAALVPPPAAAKPVEPPAGAQQNMQEQKRQFIASGSTSADYITAAYLLPASPYEIKAGDIISAALMTAINSDLPGEIVAQVTRNVFDHPTGRHLLIPQGARLVGRYDSQIAYGQSRALIVWNRIVMPDGRSINIGSMTGGDGQGASGLADRVDGHIGPITRAIALSTAITVGGLVAQDAGARSNGNLVLSDAAGGVSAQASQAGQRFVDRDLNRQPTITIRAGWPLVVIASKDIILEPY